LDEAIRETNEFFIGSKGKYPVEEKIVEEKIIKKLKTKT